MPKKSTDTTGATNRQPVNLSTEILSLRDGNEIAASELVGGLQSASPEVVMAILTEVAKDGRADIFKLLMTVTEIMTTESFVNDPEKKALVERAAKRFGLQWWLEKAGKSVGRDMVLNWWQAFTHIATSSGVTMQGISSANPAASTLWKATRALAVKIAKNLPKYGYIQPYNINDPALVEKVLGEIKDPVAWLEILVGEAWEDLQQSPEFLAAFSSIDKDGIGEDLSPEEGAIATLTIALQTK